jgi:hypothetical protein
MCPTGSDYIAMIKSIDRRGPHALNILGPVLDIGIKSHLGHLGLAHLKWTLSSRAGPLL